MKRRQPFSRTDRLGHQVQREVATFLLRGTVRGVDAGEATITGVLLSSDLRVARVCVQVHDSERAPSVLAALGRASGYLRRKLGQRLVSRVTPELRFELDDSLDMMARMAEVLARVSTPDGEGEGEGEGGVEPS